MSYHLRKSLLRAFILVFLFCLTISAFAHPGSLDENGGHYNRKTGEYHYHDGTHTESSSYNTYYPTNPPVKEYTPSPTHTPKPVVSLRPSPSLTPAPSKSVSVDFISFDIFLFWLIICIVFFINLSASESQYLFKPYKINFHRVGITDKAVFTKMKQLYNKCVELSNENEHNKINELKKQARQIVKDNFPKMEINENWLISTKEYPGGYDVYVSKHGKNIHTKKGCCGADRPVNISIAVLTHNSFCNKCTDRCIPNELFTLSKILHKIQTDRFIRIQDIKYGRKELTNILKTYECFTPKQIKVINTLSQTLQSISDDMELSEFKDMPTKENYEGLCHINDAARKDVINLVHDINKETESMITYYQKLLFKKRLTIIILTLLVILLSFVLIFVKIR